MVLPEGAQRADEVPGGPSRRGVEAGGRLVEEHELRVAHERDAEVEPALLAAGERLHPCARLVGEPDELDHLVHVPRTAGSTPRTCDGPRGRSARAAAPSAAGRLRSAPGDRCRCPTGRRRARARRRRPARGTPRGSRPSSSCPRRSARAGRTPRRGARRSRSRGRPRCRRRTSAGLGPGSPPRRSRGELELHHRPGREARVGTRHGERDLRAVGLVADRRDRPRRARDGGPHVLHGRARGEPRLDPERRARRLGDRLGGLARPRERAREDEDGRLRRSGQLLAERARLLPALSGQLAQLVRVRRAPPWRVCTGRRAPSRA